MSSLLNKTLLGADLDFLIAQESRNLDGLAPSGLVGKTWSVGREALELAFEVEVNGRQTTIDTRFVVSLSRYKESETPTKGAVLQDRESGEQYKVARITRDDMGLFLRLDCVSRYQG